MTGITEIINDLLSNDLIKGKYEYEVELISIQKRYNDKKFKIAVVGEFSSGKSTFINALIGKDILKHATLETTATVTYIYNSKQYEKLIINYSNGKSAHYKDLNYIKESTTTMSEEDVVNTIDSVEIYTKFDGIDEEIILVDTPGLNGVADKHREKTIEQIRKAHACIYVLQKNGISDSDREFLRFLFKYQRNFIFVQNFIDELKESEGETLEKKLTALRRDIDNIVDLNKTNIEYEVEGVSALKAVAGKDKCINRLYENDLVDLNDRTRKNCLEESNIRRIENLISLLNEKINNEKVRYRLAIYSLNVFLHEVIKRENEIIEIQNQYIKNDELFKNKIQIDKEINELNNEKDTKKQKLENYLDSQLIKYKKDLKEDLKEKLITIQEEINSIIDREKNYEQFEKKCREQFYQNEIQLKIDKYKTYLDNIELSIMQYIYNNMIKRFKQYTNSSLKKVAINGSMELTDVEAKVFDLDDKEKEIEGLKKRYEDIKVEERLNEKNISEFQKEIYDINKSEKNKKQRLKYLEDKKEEEKQKLGNRPEKYEEYYIEDVKVERKGIFKGLREFLFGSKVEKQKIPRYNDSKGQEWDRQIREIEKKYINQRQNINRELNELIEERNICISNLEKNQSKKEYNEREKKYLDEEIKIKEEELKQYKKNARQEYLRVRKTQLKKDMNIYFWGEEDKESKKSIKYVFEDKINKDFEKNREIISKNICNRFDECIKNELYTLEKLKEGNMEELNKKYYNNQDSLEKLKNIYNTIEGIAKYE